MDIAMGCRGRSANAPESLEILSPAGIMWFALQAHIANEDCCSLCNLTCSESCLVYGASLAAHCWLGCSDLTLGHSLQVEKAILFTAQRRRIVLSIAVVIY